MTANDEPERVLASKVTANFFETLEVKPKFGRGLLSGEDESGRDQAVILSYGLWQRQFGADPGVLGQTVELDGKTYTVIGVMEKGFDFPTASDLWIPLALDVKETTERAARTLRVFGRLKAGISVSQAQSEMETIGRRLALNYPQTNKDRRLNVMLIREFVEGTLTRAYTI